MSNYELRREKKAKNSFGRFENLKFIVYAGIVSLSLSLSILPLSFNPMPVLLNEAFGFYHSCARTWMEALVLFFKSRAHTPLLINDLFMRRSFLSLFTIFDLNENPPNT